MLNSRIVYIIGFMGSGKTTTGKKLASMLGWSFIDLDKKIEEHAGTKIPEIFSRYGEDYFRKIESEVLRKMKVQTNTVISTGGGAPCHDDNMDFMLETGLTIYLKLTSAQLKRRLSESKGERPLLKGVNKEDLQSFIENRLTFREKYYCRAEIQIESFEMDYAFLHSMVKKNLNI
jgi:shikimate kinase